MDEIHENQLSEVLPYQFESAPDKNSNCSEYSSASETQSSSAKTLEWKHKF